MNLAQYLIPELPVPRLSDSVELKRGGSNRHRALDYCLRMTFSEDRCPLFRIMRQATAA